MVNSPWKRKCSTGAEKPLTPHDFERHQWQKTQGTSVVYLIYKWCIALLFVIVLFCSIFNGERYGKTDNKYWKWLIYLTNWGFTLCTMQSLLSLWIVQAAWFRKRSIKDGREYVPKYYKLYWIIHSAATDVAFTVTLMYWLVVHSAENKNLDAINIIAHAGNSILMLIDLCIVKHPMPFLHAIYGISVGSCYTVFSYVYYACGGTDRKGLPYVYKAMDWRLPDKAIKFALISVAVVTAAHCVSWAIVKLRKAIAEREKDHNDQPISELGLQEKAMISDIA